MQVSRDAEAEASLRKRLVAMLASAGESDSVHAYPVITQRRRAPWRQLACRTRRYVSVSAS